MKNENFDDHNKNILSFLQGTNAITSFLVNYHENINFSEIPFNWIINAFKKGKQLISEHEDKNILENIIFMNKDYCFNSENFELLLQNDFNFTIDQILKNKYKIKEISDYFLKNISFDNYIQIEKHNLLPEYNFINNNNYFVLDQKVFEYMESKNLININIKESYNLLEQLIYDINYSDIAFSKNDLIFINNKIESMANKYIIQEENFNSILELLLSNKINLSNFTQVINSAQKNFNISKYIDIEDMINRKESITNNKKNFLINNYFLVNKNNMDIIELLYKSKKYSFNLLTSLTSSKGGFNYQNLVSPFLLRKEELSVWDFSHSQQGIFKEIYNYYKEDIIKDETISLKIKNKYFPFDIIKNEGSSVSNEINHLENFFEASSNNELIVRYLTNNGQKKSNIKKFLLKMEDLNEFKLFLDNLKEGNPQTYDNIFDLNSGYIMKHLDLKSLYESKILKIELKNNQNEFINKKRL